MKFSIFHRANSSYYRILNSSKLEQIRMKYKLNNHKFFIFIISKIFDRDFLFKNNY